MAPTGDHHPVIAGPTLLPQPRAVCSVARVDGADVVAVVVDPTRGVMLVHMVCTSWALQHGLAREAAS